MPTTNKLDEFFDESRTSGVVRRIRTPKRRRKTPKKDLETPVVKECLVWLNRQGYYCERRNTGAVKFGEAFVRYGTPGGADIFAVIHGRHIEIECKRRDGKGRLSDNQKEFRRLMKDYEIPYIVVCSADQLAVWVGGMRLHWTR